MLYQSTRSHKELLSSCEAILKGIAPDGGLFIPEGGLVPEVNYKALVDLDPYELSASILSAFFNDFTKEEMLDLVHAAYDGKFKRPDLTPVTAVGDDFVLELFHGPTSAFKDVALCMLPQLISASRKKLGITDTTMILTATSGDTGKAALEGFKNVEGTSICVFYPFGGVSKVQEAQMATQEGNNVKVLSVRGNFDDCQSGVKKIFAQVEDEDLLKGLPVKLSSANSINIGRLVPQIVYYFKAYGDVVRSGRISAGDKLDFSVPTGNFGDIFAGYLAKLIGLPVGKLICASNKNDVLTEFLSTGRYNKVRPFYKTTSPSMDILISSNLERLLYFVCGSDETCSHWMKELSETGEYQVPAEILSKIRETFGCISVSDEEAADVIRRVWTKDHYLMDTHTAAAWKGAEAFHKEGNAAPVVVLSTASAYKFPVAVLTALGQDVPEDEFETMRALEAYTGCEIPSNLASLEGKPFLHKEVIEKEEMLSSVMNYCR